MFLHQKCGRSHLKNTLSLCPKNVRTGQTPSSSDCGRLLWTAPNKNLKTILRYNFSKKSNFATMLRERD